MACGITPFPSFDPAFDGGCLLTLTLQILSPGTGAAALQITGNAAPCFNGVFDDNLVVVIPSGNGAGTYTCSTGVNFVSRFRFNISIANISVPCDVPIFSLTTTFGGTVWFDCTGVQIPTPPTNVGACVMGDFPAQSTVQAGCSYGVIS